MMKAKNAVKYFIKAMVIIAMIFMLPVAKKAFGLLNFLKN